VTIVPVSRALSIKPIPDWKPFPVSSLPQVCREIVEEGAEFLDIDQAMLAVPLLPILSGCIGRSISIRAYPGYEQPSILWALLVARSGTKKSPSLKVLREPLDKIADQRASEHVEHLKDYRRKLAAFKEGKQSEEPFKPDERRLLVDDTTVEAAAVPLSKNPRGLIMLKPEAEDWFTSFTKISKNGKSDRAKWLPIYDGGGISIDRKNPESPRIHADKTALSIVGLIQPGILQKSISDGDTESGLLARILFATPPAKAMTLSRKSVSTATLNAYAALIERLLDEDPFGRNERLVTLSDEALALFKTAYDRWGQLAFEAEEREAAAYGKCGGLALRFALVHHVVTCINCGVTFDCEVTTTAMRFGIELTDWFMNEAIRTFAAMSEDEGDRQARLLVEWISSRGGRVLVRELQRRSPKKYAKSEDAKEELQKLVDAGYGEWEKKATSAKGGQPTRYFCLFQQETNSPNTVSDPVDPQPATDTTPSQSPPTNDTTHRDTENSLVSIGSVSSVVVSTGDIDTSAEEPMVSLKSYRVDISAIRR
jgi:hypothetical protein